MNSNETNSTQPEFGVEDVITQLVLTYCGQTALERWANRSKRSKQRVEETVRRSVSNMLTRASLYRRG